MYTNRNIDIYVDKLTGWEEGEWEWEGEEGGLDKLIKNSGLGITWHKI